MTDEAFAQFCAEHPDLTFETIEGRGIAGEATTSFVLPNGARRSPNASWILKSEVQKLSRESRESFWHLCPAFAVELRSKTGRFSLLRKKMAEYVADGAQLGWLIDPETRTVEIYRPAAKPRF